MMSNVSLYPFNPARDEYFAYECSSEQPERRASTGAGSGHVYGQIRFEMPWVSLPDTRNAPRHISFEELELEMEREARRQEY